MEARRRATRSLQGLVLPKPSSSERMTSVQPSAATNTRSLSGSDTSDGGSITRPVETTSARALTTDLFARQAADPGLARAKAAQQAMLALIDGPGFVEGGRTVFSYAHPIFWAPFAVVGDGG